MTARWKWIDLPLAAALLWSGWMFAAQVNRATDRATIFKGAQPAPDAPTGTSPAATRPVRVADYAPVWLRLFGPPTEATRSQPPALGRSMDSGGVLPLLYGVADLGNGPAALLATGPGQRARWTAPGQEIGGYRLLSIDQTKLVFSRDGMRFEASPAELRDSRRPSRATRPVQAAATRTAGGVGRTIALDKGPSSGSGRFQVGAEFRPGRFAADAGDGATDGTEHEGYVRRVRQTPFGEQHWWEKAAEQ